jgi:DNA-binding NarL/FixJ family response regulator
VPIRVILVDDHAVVREGLGRLLEAEPDIEVLGSFDDAAAALAGMGRLRPDVAVLDIAMPGMSGIELARALGAAAQGVRVLMLSMYRLPEYVHQSFAAGALGYLLKESAGRELIAAVRAVHSGRRYVGRGIDHALADGSRGAQSPLDLLSERERQVLRLVVEGRTSAQTALALNLSPKSVETYRSRLMKKLGVEDLPALVKFAIRHGVTEL